MSVIHYRSLLARRALLVFPFALALACRGKDSGNVESAQTWSPEKLASVKGVPAAEIEAAMQRKLGGDRPVKIDDDQWGHTERLYKLYGNNPLWLSADGLHKTRTKALTDALLAANADGMRMADYPIGSLATAIAAVKQSEKPTAEQLATVDVILTAAFVALGEDLLTGQIDPRSVSQSWHVDPEEENVDSALVRNLRF
ncbi:MAG TPA: hypothetical protein VJZ25_00570, partial [Gemmatimonadaceae bacterium]|nr:hypothetical protein [Gemmatimonadaceae bacterium]